MLYECQNNVLHQAIVIMFHFDDTDLQKCLGLVLGIIPLLKVPYGFQSICKQTCKHLVRGTLHIVMYMLIFSQSNF